MIKWLINFAVRHSFLSYEKFIFVFTCFFVFIFTALLFGHFWIHNLIKLILFPITKARSASNGDRNVGNIEARIKYKSSHIFVPVPVPVPFPDWRCELEYEEEEGVLHPTKNSLFVSCSSPCRIHLEGKERNDKKLKAKREISIR